MGGMARCTSREFSPQAWPCAMIRQGGYLSLEVAVSGLSVGRMELPSMQAMLATQSLNATTTGRG